MVVGVSIDAYGSLSTTYISPAEVARLLSNVTGGSKSVEQLQQLMAWHINIDKCLTDNLAVVHILKGRTFFYVLLKKKNKITTPYC